MIHHTLHHLCLATIVAGSPLLSACSASSPGAPANAVQVASSGQATSENVVDDEASLRALLDEEKLAHDVYLALGRTHGLRVFENIRRAEVRHQAAMRSLLARTGQPLPHTESKPGVFEDTEVQALYDRLVKEGQSSVAAALRVGALIEEMDIFDLRTARSHSTDPEVRHVLSQLERASENHFRAFHRQLVRTGATYQPKHLTEHDIDAILSAKGGARS